MCMAHPNPACNDTGLWYLLFIPKRVSALPQKDTAAGTFSLLSLKKCLFVRINSSAPGEAVLPKTSKRVRRDLRFFGVFFGF